MTFCHKDNKGFVLLELITVIFILAALVLIFVPNFRWSILKAQVTGCQANIKNLSTAIQTYSIDNGDQYPQTLDKITPEYIKYIPTCPAAGIDTYYPGYEVKEDLRIYTLKCKGRNHTDVGLGEDEPYYSLQEGLQP